MRRRRDAHDIDLAILAYIKHNGPSTKSRIMRANNLDWFCINNHLLYLSRVGLIERFKHPKHFGHPARELYRITFDGEKYLEIFSSLAKKETT